MRSALHLGQRLWFRYTCPLLLPSVISWTKVSPMYLGKTQKSAPVSAKTSSMVTQSLTSFEKTFIFTRAFSPTQKYRFPYTGILSPCAHQDFFPGSPRYCHFFAWILSFYLPILLLWIKTMPNVFSIHLYHVFKPLFHFLCITSLLIIQDL